MGWRHRQVRRGTVMLAWARLGMVRRGWVWTGLARFGLSTAVSASCAFTEADSFTRYGAARLDLVRRGGASCALVRRGGVWADNSLKHRVRCLGMR